MSRVAGVDGAPGAEGKPPCTVASGLLGRVDEGGPGMSGRGRGPGAGRSAPEAGGTGPGNTDTSGQKGRRTSRGPQERNAKEAPGGTRVEGGSESVYGTGSSNRR